MTLPKKVSSRTGLVLLCRDPKTPSLEFKLHSCKEKLLALGIFELLLDLRQGTTLLVPLLPQGDIFSNMSAMGYPGCLPLEPRRRVRGGGIGAQRCCESPPNPWHSGILSPDLTFSPGGKFSPGFLSPPSCWGRPCGRRLNLPQEESSESLGYCLGFLRPQAFP